MGDILTTRWYRVTAIGGGSVEFPVSTRDFDMNPMMSEKEVVAHAAWCWLFNIPEKSRVTAERNRVSVVLKNLCDSLGVEKVKKRFEDNIQFERIR